MKDIIELKQKDLTLAVEYDITKIDMSEWEDYLDILCGERNYQKEAIKTAINYLVGDNYSSLEDLVKYNYKKSNFLKDICDLPTYLKSLLFADKQFANIDLATGTGKSYVMYGIAHILLAMGKIKQVLLICPSITIEQGLTDKFINLASNVELLNAIPSKYEKIIPTIIDANSTITAGSICIENIHAVYENTGSSISDSLKGNGLHTLVLNDESHHIFNKHEGKSTEEIGLKKWADFLLSKDYNFKYILGFTGTAYTGNDYFKDVIYRYSLKDAIESGFIKTIEYVQESDVVKKEDEKFQIILQTHSKNKQLYGKILKPLTILITKDIEVAKKLKEKWINFLISTELLNRPDLDKEKIFKQLEEKVLLITYKSSEQEKLLLNQVDSNDSKIEYIISVSMLNEGWDVKNVFQIVPMEEKAFNSKLLIAQVLGRGLRKPELTTNPKVIVMNHDAWGKNIKSLVDELLELETKIEITSSKIRSKFDFELANLDYSKEPCEIENTTQDKKPFDYSNMAQNGIALESQAVIRQVVFEFEDIKGHSNKKDYSIKSHTWTINEVLDKLFRELSSRNWEGVVLRIDKQLYSKDKLPSREVLKNIIEKSLSNRGIPFDTIEDKNVQRILSAFSTLLRKTNKTIEYKTIVHEPFYIKTNDANRENIGLSNFRKDSCLFYPSNWNDDDLTDINKEVVSYFLGDESFPKSAEKSVRPELFKTPYTFVITSSKPEKAFVEQLVKKEVAEKIQSWVKSKNKGFYSIEYRMKGGSEESSNREYKSHGFNPDFFIKTVCNDDNYVIVIEIKADNDLCLENKAKYKYAQAHFTQLNKKLSLIGKKEKYIFHMLSPSDFPAFFEALKNESIYKLGFKGSLEIGLTT